MLCWFLYNDKIKANLKQINIEKLYISIQKIIHIIGVIFYFVHVVSTD